VDAIEHRGVELLRLDFSRIKDTDVALDAIAEARGAISTRGANSVRTLVMVADSIFNVEIARALWRLARADRRNVRAAAVVGLSGVQEAVLHLVERMSRRTFATFNDVEAAKDWLVEQ